MPFPYVSVDQYEQSIRAPVGKTWNPETAVKELVKPKIITKLGSIIQPISKADVFKNDSKKRRADMSFHGQSAGPEKHKKRKKWWTANSNNIIDEHLINNCCEKIKWEKINLLYILNFLVYLHSLIVENTFIVEMISYLCWVCCDGSKAQWSNSFC